LFALILVYLFLLSVKLTSGFEYSCIITSIYTILFSSLILNQLILLKKEINQIACPFCSQNSLCQKFCKSTKIYTLFALILSVIISLSLLSFLILADYYFLIVIAIDIFVFHYLYNHWNQQKINTQLTPSGFNIYKELAVNFFNIFILLIMFVGLELYFMQNVQMSPEIFNTINETVQHNCKIFQHILRTRAFLDQSIEAMRQIDSIGHILFAFFYISTLSLFPMMAITFLFKFAIKTQYKIQGDEK